MKLKTFCLRPFFKYLPTFGTLSISAICFMLIVYLIMVKFCNICFNVHIGSENRISNLSDENWRLFMLIPIFTYLPIFGTLSLSAMCLMLYFCLKIVKFWKIFFNVYLQAIAYFFAGLKIFSVWEFNTGNWYSISK